MTRDIAAEHKEVVDGLLEFTRKYVVPLELANQDLLEEPRAAYAPDGSYSKPVVDLLREVRMKSAEAGYYAIFAPEDVGGAGLGPVAHYLTWKALYGTYGPGRLLPFASVAHWTSGVSFLMALLDPGLRGRIGAELMAGSTTCCFAMSEPDAGSDAWGLSTRAVRDGDDWVINGVKQWITNSPHADYAITFAVTDEKLRAERKGGISCFLVPTDSPGFAVDSVIKLFGHAGGNEGILSYSDVRVSAEHLMGDLGGGFRTAIRGVSLGRMYNAGRCVGLAEYALRAATAYAQQRRTFGHAISEYQGVGFQLSDSAIDVYAGHTMSMDCALRLESGSSAVRDVAMVKAYTTEMCSRVYDRCMQVFGGMGLTNEMKLYDGWHQARIVRIADGSGEIMRRTILDRLLAGELEF